MSQIAHIVDPRSGAEARILVSQGFNCFEFIVGPENARRNLLWAEDGFEFGERRASSSGIPILFPFPGRIQGTVLHWQGDAYSLEAGDGRGNAIHGFALDNPWRVIDQSQSAVMGEFQLSRDAPDDADRWPSDFKLTVAYEIRGQSLRCAVSAENVGDATLPCGLGLHPYFSLEAIDSDIENCRIKLPVSTAWEMRDMIATGKVAPLENADDYAHGLRFGDLSFDNGFGGLTGDNNRRQAAIESPDGGQKLSIEFGAPFREMVVYNPPHREAICIEPYTCICDPFRLESEGIDAGLIQLEPAASFSAEMTIAFE